MTGKIREIVARLNKPFRAVSLEREFLRHKQSMTIQASKIIYLSLAMGLIAIEASDDLSGYTWIPLKAHLLRASLVVFLLVYVAFIHYARYIIDGFFLPIFVGTGLVTAGAQHYLEYLSRNNADPSFYFLSTASLTYMQVIGLYTFLKPELKTSFPVSVCLVIFATGFATLAYPTHHLAIQRLLYYQCAAVTLGLVIYYWTIKDERRLFLKNKRLAKTATLQKKLIVAQEEANEAKSRFLSTLSHEMRTPMAAIVNTINLLELKGLFSDPQSAKLAKGMRGSCDRLLSTMNDVLDYAQGNSPGILRVKEDHFCLRALVEAIESLFQATAASRGLEFKVSIVGDDSDPVQSDFEKLNRVIVNLVSNSLKFTQAGRVELIATRRASGEPLRELVRFEVIDTGEGIAESEIPKIFKPFYQVDSARNRKYQGNGLGLAICDQLMNVLGGTIAVTSKLGRGTHFVVELVCSVVPRSIELK